VSENGASKPFWPWVAAGLIIAAMVAVLVIWGRSLYELVADQGRIRTWVADLSPWGPVGIVALEMAQTLVAPIPGQAIEAVSGYLFGPWLGTLYAMAGIVAGSLLSFFLARRFGRPLLLRLTSPKAVDRLDDLAQRGGPLFFFLLWLFPFVPDDLACLAAGLTPMRTRQFLLLMALGRMPGIVISTWVGSNAARISPVWWGVLLACLTVAALALWRWGNKIQATMLDLLRRITDQLRR
jgi:uncharacterized membrane protein YdjX (TVP38/TMEM64 family)